MWKSFQKELYPFRSSENSDQSETLTNVKTVRKSLLRRQPLLIMREYIVEKGLLYVMNVGKLSGITQLCWNIRKAILMRNHAGMMNAEKPLGRAQLLLIIKDAYRRETL